MIELNTIYNEDCLEGMKRIPDVSVDMVLCDLPYGTTNLKWDICLPFDKLWEQWLRVCKENAAIVCFGSEPFSSFLRVSNLKMFKYDWIWDKRTCSGFLNAKKQPLRSNEIISVFYKKQCTYNPQMSNDRKKREFYMTKATGSEIYNTIQPKERHYTKNQLAFPKSILQFTGVVNNSKEKCGHPTQKPVDLCEYLIKTYTNEGDTVLDNCMGSGTTAVACINQGRNFIGFELDKGYWEISQKRIAEARKNVTEKK